MAEYLSKVLIESLRLFDSDSFMKPQIPVGHFETLTKRGFIENHWGDIVITDKGRAVLDEDK